MLNAQEFGPHKEGVLVGAHLLEEVSEDRDDFFAERVVTISFTVLDLLLKRIFKSDLDSKDAFFGRLAHQDHSVDKDCLVNELVLLDGLFVVLELAHAYEDVFAAFD